MNSDDKPLVIDMTEKKKKRVKKGKIWEARKEKLMEAGFSEKEAKAGASEGMPLKHKQMKKTMQKRKDSIEWKMKAYGLTRKKAIKDAEHQLEAKLRFRDKKRIILFYEISP